MTSHSVMYPFHTNAIACACSRRLLINDQLFYKLSVLCTTGIISGVIITVSNYCHYTLMAERLIVVVLLFFKYSNTE